MKIIGTEQYKQHEVETDTLSVSATSDKVTRALVRIGNIFEE
jgi:hypothetical protein